jgi:hypothetical protein
LFFAREILHYVQDDRIYGDAMHCLVLKWNKKIVRGHPEPKARDLTKKCNVQLPVIFAREILHFVQDDRSYGGVIHWRGT